MFCKNCGQQIEEGVANCPNCGTAVEQPKPAFDMDAIKQTVASGVDAVKGNANIKKFLPIGIAVVAVILVVVIACSVFTRSAKSAAMGYVEATAEGDMKAAYKYLAIDYEKFIEAQIEANEDLEYDSYDEYCEEKSEERQDYMEDKYEDYSFDIEYKRTKEYDDDEVEDFIEEVEETMEWKEYLAEEADMETTDFLDPEDISDVCEVKLKTTIEYEDEDGDTQKEKETIEVTCVKMGMKWYVWRVQGHIF